MARRGSGGCLPSLPYLYKTEADVVVKVLLMWHAVEDGDRDGHQTLGRRKTISAHVPETQAQGTQLPMWIAKNAGSNASPKCCSVQRKGILCQVPAVCRRTDDRRAHAKKQARAQPDRK
jgi:hypothetical protein